MKVFVVLALIAVCSASQEHKKGHGRHVTNFCEGMNATREDAENWRILIKTATTQIIGKHCRTADKRLSNDRFYNDDCKKAFDQGFCYVTSKYNKYIAGQECTYGEGDEEYSFSMNYQNMADIITSGEIDKLGHLGCKRGLPCFKSIVRQISKCAEENVGFYDNVIKEAKDVLEPRIKEFMETADEKIICHFGENSDALKLFQMVKERITSFDDIVALVNEYVSGDTQDTILSEAKVRLHEFLDRAAGFCKAECIGKTADFFGNVFEATHDADTCPTIGIYCGDCQVNAETYISETAGSIPCCTQGAMDRIATVIQSVIDKYGDLISEIEAAVIGAVEEADISIDNYENVKDMVMKQADCLKETYGILEQGDCDMHA